MPSYMPAQMSSYELMSPVLGTKAHSLRFEEVVQVVNSTSVLNCIFLASTPTQPFPLTIGT